MNRHDATTRQLWGCAYEAPIEGARPWSPSSMNRNYTGDEPTVCPVYTTNLPEVIEIARARLHAKEFGNLNAFCGGEPTDLINQGIEISEGAYNELQRWLMTPSKDGGGAA